MKWFPLLLLWVIANLIAYALNWAFPMAAQMVYGPVDNNTRFDTEPRLPAWLSWAMTYDNSLWGDGAFKASHNGGYWSQVAWLYRNSCYGFERKVLGAVIRPDDVVTFSGNAKVRDQPEGVEGFCFTRVGKYWGLRWVRETAWIELALPALAFLVIGYLFSSVAASLIALLLSIYSAGLVGDSRCLNFTFGWKLQTYAEDPTRVHTQPTAQFVVSPRCSSFRPAANIETL